jgi:hypothetical protein
MYVQREYPLRRRRKKALKKSILLLSRYRGGSSFIGNIFNKNQDLVYFFEPLALYGHGDDKNIEKKVQFLSQIFHGQVPSFKNAPGHEDVNLEEDIVSQCEEHGICMWQLSTRFCRAPFCLVPNAPSDHCGLACPHVNTHEKMQKVQTAMDESKEHGSNKKTV